MRTGRRLALALPALLPAAAAAQGWAPSRPIRLIVPFTAGGATDASARIMAERMGPLLGQPVMVENRPGAGGNVGAEAAAKADPDGHTLLMCTIGTASINQFLYPRLPFDPQRDFAPIALVSMVANGIIAHPSLPAQNLREMIDFARRNPGRLNYATPGNGSSGHMSGEYLKFRTGVDIGHVPYRGTGVLLPDLLAGRVDLSIDNLPAYLPHLREGRLRLLAVTSRERWFAVPEAPTVIESGIADFEAVAWFGLQAPARTPEAALRRLSEVALAILAEPATQQRFRDIGAAATPLDAAAFQRFIEAENAKWSEVVRVARIRLE
ncbi:MAG: tripartite tricarboxylate transporter substrate binding protein [Rhodovarius sp.]|nr:tripartite tricarboxylate transporter substrate binding protein [Rhodovarius sp.]